MPDRAKDARLAERVREIAQMQTDTELMPGGKISAAEKSRILNIAADVFEQYIMEADHV